MKPIFENVLHEIRTLHATVPEVADFVAFPNDLEPIELKPRHLPCADYFMQELCFKTAEHPLARAFYQAGPEVYWRDTYAGTDVSEDFMQRFGCYCVIGSGGAWISQSMAAYVVVMPSGLHYPWHQHPAEEMYYVLAGEGVFMRKGEANETLTAGNSVIHASNQPHALETRDQPVMAYVVWRNHLGIKPVLTG